MMAVDQWIRSDDGAPESQPCILGRSGIACVEEREDIGRFDAAIRNQITRWKTQLCNGAHDGMAVARKSLEFLDLSEF